MKNTFRFYLLILFVLFLSFSLSSLYAQRGVKVVVKTSEGSFELYNQYRALVIGVGDYLYWPKLPSAVKDAREVASVLKERGFITKILENPTSEEIKSALDRLVFRESGAGDGVLIYFAGHGETMKLADGTELGYIIPKDCPLRLNNTIGFTRKAISMEDIQTYSMQIKSKHMIVLFDSCFSGSIFSLGRAAPTDITFKTAQPVRQYITAGSADEIVPDKSIFKDCFLDALKGEADLNNDSYITGSELGMYLESNVVNYSRNAQHPQYGKIRNPKLDKGDFVFVLEKTKISDSQKAQLIPKPQQVRPQYSPLTAHKIRGNIHEVKGGAGANSGFIITEKEVVVIDAKTREESAKQMIAEIKKLTSNPIKYVIITHSDGDHVMGLGGFPPDVTVVSHHQTKKDMDEAFKDPKLRLLLPNVTFSKKKELYSGNKTIKLFHFGPAHTSGDIVVYIPDQKVAFLGDLLFLGRDPLVHKYKNGNSFGLVKTLKNILKLDADTFVHGHGDIASKSDIEGVIKSLEDKQLKIKTLIKEGKSLEEIKKAFNVEDRPPRPGRQRRIGLVEAIYLEITEKK